MAYTRDRECKECGKIETVRKDNKSEICVSCSCRINGKKGLQSIRENTKWKKCKNCDNKIEAYKKWDYCSKECSHKEKIEKRKCKECDCEFEILKSKLKSSNTSGNFCSRKCYENYLCDTDRTTGRGSQWKKIRNIAIKKAPFCAICGTTKNLQVHHIIPFRYTNDNSQSNLIPLCIKHHKKVEIITNDILKVHRDFKISKLIISSMLKENQLATFAKIKAVVVSSKKLIDNKE